jgi:hypothetical protein
MGRIRIGVAAVTLALALALVPASAEAKKKKPKPPTHAEKCEQAPAGGKGPLDHTQVTYTNECFDSFESGIGATLQAIDREVQGCPTMPESGRGELANGDQQLAKAGEKDVEQTKKAKAGYFKAEGSWYASHKGKHHSAIAEQLGAVTDDVGQAAFRLSGVYADIESVASAFRNNDCGEAATHLADARSELAKAKDKISELRTALGKLPAK